MTGEAAMHQLEQDVGANRPYLGVDELHVSSNCPYIGIHVPFSVLVFS
jgi:hypothetical protein